jgi:hypothetical protein
MPTLKAHKAEYLKPSKPKMMLYGKPDTDKSKFACEFPASVYIDTEDGAVESEYVKSLNDSKSLYFGKADGSQNLKEVIDQVKALIVAPGDRQSLVIDSVSKSLDVSDSEEQERMGDKDDPFSSYKKAGVRQMRRLVSLLGQLDMNVLLVAHAKDKWEGQGKERKLVGTTFDAWAKLGHEMNLQCESQRVGAVTFMRVFRSKYACLIRGQEIPMSYEAFAKAYGKDVMERKAEGLVLATKDQVEEILKMTGILKTEQDELDSWLNKAGAEEIVDLSKEHATKLIEFLNKKLKGEK